jgi:hypothetical protein
MFASRRRASDPALLRSGLGAWVAGLIIVVVAWAPFLGTLHQAFVRHVVCEHGDLIETDDGTKPPAHADERRSLDDDLGAVSTVNPSSGSAVHGHNHCSVGTLARSVATISTTQARGILVAEGRPVSLAARDAEPVRSVLTSAPKTSPPV